MKLWILKTLKNALSQSHTNVYFSVSASSTLLSKIEESSDLSVGIRLMTSPRKISIAAVDSSNTSSSNTNRSHTRC